jgi:hypothetical protein
MVRAKGIRIGSLLAAVLLAVALVGCGGNSTPVGVTVSAAGVSSGATATVIEGQTLQFTASVSGTSSSTVYWQICLPATAVTSPPTQPTTCTPIPGVTTNPTNTSTNLAGYGTITQTGLYTAPATPPSPNNFVIMASSTISPTNFGILNTQIDSGVRLQLTPASVSIVSSGTFQFTASVTGSSNQGISWSASGGSSGNVAGGNAQIGYICPNPAAPQPCAPGEYVAPATSSGITVTITATSSADTSKTANATVTVLAPGDPTLSTIDPNAAAQGSAQQDIYLTGQNFATNDTVLVTPPGQSATTVTPVFISPTLLRATIPWNLLSQAGRVAIQVMRQNGTLSIPGPLNLTLSPVRPAIIALTPDNISQTPTAANVNLTGGFFSPGTTTVQFNGGASGAVAPSFTNSRQLSFGTPAGAVSAPGLYPITVQNAGIALGQPTSAAMNLSVTPAAASIGSAPSGTPITVGVNPVAVAVDYASEIAVVVNSAASGSNGSVSLINLSSNTVVNTITTGIGKNPTGVAIDDLLSPPVALVVNSGDQTVSTINLTTQIVTSVVSVAIGPGSGSNAGTAPVPFSVGINPLTHHAVVAYQSFNEATILDVSSGTPTLISQVGGNLLAPLGTGASPSIAIDPEVNWAIITPGGGGLQTTTIVDLGRTANASTGDVGRAPAVIASFGLASSGVGIDSETHQAFLTDPNSGNFTSFSLLDSAVNSITFTNNGIPLNLLGYVAAAVDPLTGIGVAVNGVSDVATIVNIETGTVLQPAVTLAGLARAVAIDPYSNQAVVVNQSAGTGSVSVLSLGNALNPVQIVESSPSIAYTTATAPLTLTITGGGFNLGTPTTVLLDGTALTPSFVSANGRQIVATVPLSMLGSARHYSVQVRTGTGASAMVSNVRDLTVIQPVAVGTSPVGVAVDTDRDLAVVTNSGSNTVSLVALTPATPVGSTQVPAGAVGTTGQPISVGSMPLGVAVLPRLGLALVANNSSNNISLVDVTRTFPAQTVPGCSTGATCTGQSGVAIDQDAAVGVVANSTSNNNFANNTANNISYITITGSTTTGTATTPPSVAASSTPTADLDPTAVAIDPVINAANITLGGYAAVTSASQASTVQLLTVPGGALAQRLSGYQVPTDIKFDPLNQVFLVANSLLNEVVVLNPSSFAQTTISAGINPTALDYNFQTSTLATVNRAANTVSILDYVCPPVIGVTSSCPNPQVQTVLGIGGSQQFSIAVDPKLNLAVVVDQINNRVLLVPLPH